jgi:hypothetical protein
MSDVESPNDARESQGRLTARGLRRWSRFFLGIGLIVSLLSSSAAGQSGGATLGGPSLGFITDEKGSTIWPLLGILDAAIPGRPLELSHEIVKTTFSPRQNYALAVVAVNAQPVLVRLDVSDPQLFAIPGARFNPSQIVISPTGSAAALYDRGSKVLQLLAGLPDAPRLAYEYDTSLLGDVQNIAVSDDASLALVSTGIERRSLWFLDTKGSALPVNAMQPSQMTFIAERHDAIIADDGTQEVFLLQSMDQNPVRLPGIVSRGEIRQFAAIAASADGRMMFAAQQGSEDVLVMDLQAGRTAVVPCHCKPTVLSPLKGTSVFRLNGLAGGPLTVLDASSPNPRTLIIPINTAALNPPGKGQTAQ